MSEHRSLAVGGGELQAWRERKDITIEALESESRRFFTLWGDVTASKDFNQG